LLNHGAYSQPRRLPVSRAQLGCACGTADSRKIPSDCDSEMIVSISEYTPGLLGRITELHARYYHRHWGFDLFFETKVATELADFLQHFDSTRDGLWAATADGRIIGAIAVSGRDAATIGARLRWLIVAPQYQGRGYGKRLMRAAMDFCQQARFSRIYLTTFTGLDAARHLYEQEGFRVVVEQEDAHWGKTVREQTFELML
jgi:GNAT superfamily N-acetyltransferase